MTIRSQNELEVTRRKLRELEQLAEKVSQDPDEKARVREMSLQSVQRWIDRLKEEVSDYEERADKRQEDGERERKVS